MKKILALIIAMVLAFAGTIASAENYYESFRDNKWKYFRVKDDNNVISVRDSVMKFEFPEKINEDDNYAAYIYKQGMRLTDSFCAELSMRISNPAQAKGEILLRNYYSGMGFYTLAALENGNIVFPDGRICAIPARTFRIVIFRNGDFLYTLINGEQKNRCAVNGKFSFSDELELRITMNNQSVPLGSSECIEIANIYIYPDTVPEEFLSKRTDSKSYIQNFDGDGLLYFKKNDRCGAIDIRGGALSFLFPVQEEKSEIMGSSIYMQDTVINDTFCLEMNMEFDDPSLADGQILLRNYYAGQGILYLCTFKKGEVVFADGTSAELPQKFRLKIWKEENNIVSAMDGEIVSITKIPSAFSLKEKQEVRITFFSSGASETGRTHEVRLDNLMLLLDADLNELQMKEVEMFFDYGNGVYWKETELDNTEGARYRFLIGNPSEKVHEFTFIKGKDYQFEPVSLLPGEIKEVMYTTQGERFEPGEELSFFLWDSIAGMQPLQEKISITNDGVLIPSVEQWKTLLEEVPSGYAWMTKERTAELRELLDESSDSCDAEAVKYWQDIISTADTALRTSPASYAAASGVQGVTRVSDRITVLAMAYRISGFSEYAQRACAEMEAVAEYPDWRSEVSFLETAGLLRGMAIGYDAFYSYFTDEQKAKLAQAIYQKGLLPGLEIYRNNAEGSWERRSTNWNVICNSAMGIAALIVGEDNRYVDDCAIVVNTSLRRLRIALKKMSPLGAWYEGPSYWGYMLNFACDYFHMLSNMYHTNYGYEFMQNFKNCGYFPIMAVGAKTYNFDDCAMGVNLCTPLSFYFANLLNDPAVGKYHAEQLKTAKAECRDLLWYKREFADTEENPPMEYYDFEQNLMVFRDGLEENTFLGCNAGKNLTPHSQLDMGSFVYDWHGFRWFEDLGIDSYDLYDYVNYHSTKWYYYRNRAEGHNCILLSPKNFNDGSGVLPEDQIVDSKGKILDLRIGQEDFSYVTMDITPAYDGDCVKYYRTLLLDKTSKGMLIEELLNLEEKKEFYWFAHTLADIALEDDKKGAVLTISDNGEDIKLYVRILEGEGEFSVMNAVPLPTSPNPDLLPYNIENQLKQNTNEGFQKLTIHKEYDAGESRLRIGVIPYENKESVWGLISLLP